MATINKNGQPRKPHVRQRSRNTIRSVSLRADQALGPQLKQYRLLKGYSRHDLGVLMGWSAASAAPNIRNFETSLHAFSHVEGRVGSINTAIKYLQALGVKKFTFTLSD